MINNLQFISAISTGFRKAAWALFILGCACQGLSAQSFGTDNQWLKGMGIRSIGPAGMSGRVTAIEVVRENPSIIYVGTASGGLWKSSSGGINWTPIFDRELTQSIGAVAIDPGNSQVIWAGTGEGNPRNSQNSGAGIYRSLDGGRSWTRMGLEETKAIHRIIVHPRDPRTIYVGALGSAWGPNSERGVYRSRDGGNSWQKILHINDSTGCGDLIIDPSNPNKLIAAMWEYGRKPWFFTSGGKGSGLYMTYDGGENWQNIAADVQSGLPTGELGRIGVAFAASKPSVVYAIVEAAENAVYRSLDGGHTWTKRATQGIGNRPFYYAEIYVDPSNENRVYSLYSMVSRSEDGGANWEIIIPYSGVHPDHHAFYIHPDQPDLIIDGNDGGLAISHDRGKSWRFVENLPLGQFYHIAVDNDEPYNIYGGMQDNGSWAGPAYAWQYGGIRNANWQEVLFGDGFDVQPHAGDSRYGYAMWQGGNLAAYDRESGATRYIQPVHPEGLPLRFNWNAALALDPFDPKGLYYGSQYVHYSVDEGRSWRIISPDLTTNDSSRQNQAKSGGLTIDATTAENFTTLLSIAPSPVEKGLIWAGSDDGRLHVTRNGGEQWSDVYSRLPSAPKGAWIAQISASSHNPGTAFVALNDYRRNHWETYAYRTDDYANTFRRIAGPGSAYGHIEGHVMCVAQDSEVPELLFLGTENGLWFSLNGGKAWERWSKDFPSVPVSDLAIQAREGDLVIGTFGRAIWVLDDLRPLRAAARDAALMERPLVLFDAPQAVSASWKQAPGVRFDADAGFRGNNRPAGARMTLWLHPGEFEKAREEKDEKSEKSAEDAEKKEAEEKADKEKKDKGKQDKVKITVFNAQRDTIRNFTVQADTGMLRFTWDLRHNGPRYPSHNKADKDADPAGGRLALPGSYTVLAQWKSYSDSAVVEVRSDPRIEPQVSALEELARTQERYNEIQSRLQTASEKMLQALENLDRMGAHWKQLPDSVQKNRQEREKVLRDSIVALQAYMLTPKDFKGIDGEQRLIWMMYRSSRLLYSNEPPSANALKALEELEKLSSAYIKRINRFFASDWSAYRAWIDELDWSPVEEISILKIN